MGRGSGEPGIVAPWLHVGVDKELYCAEKRVSQEQEVGWSLCGSVSRSRSRRHPERERILVQVTEGRRK